MKYKEISLTIIFVLLLGVGFKGCSDKLNGKGHGHSHSQLDKTVTEINT